MKVEATVPENLVREEFNRRKWYFKGYKSVLQKQKHASEITGNNSKIAVLIPLIAFNIGNLINKKEYITAINEPGLEINKKTRLVNNLAIYRKSDVTISNKYFDVPPRLVIEVDIKVDFSEVDEEHKDFEYVLEKSQVMIDFGVERIIWISTSTKKIMVFSKTERWYITNFDETVSLFDGHELNLAQLLKDEDLEF